MTNEQRTDPFLDEGLRLWILTTAKKNFWRVSRWYDLDDLIADGYLCYARTRTRYPDLIKPPLVYGQKARFVAMFKRIYLNEIHDRANSKRRSVNEICFSEFAHGRKEQDVVEDVMGHEPEEGTLAVLLAQAPQEVKAFLAALATEAGMRSFRAELRQTSKHKETLNEKFCRMAGCDPTMIDLPSMIRDALTS